MNSMPSLLLNNETLDAEIEAFCTNNAQYLKIRQEFYETAETIAKHVGFDLYDKFEKSFHAYLFRTAELYYLFGLGIRQELLRSLGAEE